MRHFSMTRIADFSSATRAANTCSRTCACCHRRSTSAIDDVRDADARGVRHRGALLPLDRLRSEGAASSPSQNPVSPECRRTCRLSWLHDAAETGAADLQLSSPDDYDPQAFFASGVLADCCGSDSVGANSPRF